MVSAPPVDGVGAVVVGPVVTGWVECWAGIWDRTSWMLLGCVAVMVWVDPGEPAGSRVPPGGYCGMCWAGCMGCFCPTGAAVVVADVGGCTGLATVCVVNCVCRLDVSCKPMSRFGTVPCACGDKGPIQLPCGCGVPEGVWDLCHFPWG